MQQNMRPITKPDLNTIFESMLAIPADVRAQHVNAYLLTGTPEQKLAAAMIKDMPQGQAPTAPVQAPTQSVISKLSDDPGIASLAGGGIVGNYAGGGIIAFDEGGDIPSYAGPKGSYVMGNDYDPNAMLQAYTGKTAEEAQRYASNRPEYGLGQIGAWAEHRKNIEKLQKATKTPYDPAIEYYDSIGNFQGKLMAQKQRSDWLANPTNLSENAKSETPASPLPTGPTPTLTPKDKVQEAADMAAPVNKSSSFSSKLGDLDWTNITDNSSAYDKLKQEVKTPQALIEERAGLIGPDPSRAANDARLKAMEEKTGKAEEAAPWMALAQFGLGIAGARKGQEGEAISKSGISALQGLTAAKDKVEAAREKQFDLSTRQAQADRAEKIAEADYGLRSKEHTEAQNRAAELAKIGYKTDLEVKNATGAYEAKKAKVAAQLDLKKLEQSAAQHSQTIQMYKDRMKSQDAATRAKSMQVLSTLSVNIDKSPDYQAQLAALQAEFKNKGGASSPEYQKRAADLKTVFMGNMLNSLSEGAGSIPSSTDLLAD
jgi:hypothetical protein